MTQRKTWMSQLISVHWTESPKLPFSPCLDYGLSFRALDKGYKKILNLLFPWSNLPNHSCFFGRWKKDTALIILFFVFQMMYPQSPALQNCHLSTWDKVELMDLGIEKRNEPKIVYFSVWKSCWLFYLQMEDNQNK